jgi:hypothetical protein
MNISTINESRRLSAVLIMKLDNYGFEALNLRKNTTFLK